MTVRYAASCKWLFGLALLLTGFLSKAQLTANFTGTPVSGCAPLIVRFTDASTGNPNFWKWDLGNGTLSFLQNPSVTYFTPGQYNIKLYIRNGAGTADSITKTQYITVLALPTVQFTGTPLTGCFPLLVQFSDQSVPGSGTISTWEWDFGDGNVSTVQNPQHTYTAGGSYNVSLRVRNSFGCVRTLTKSQYINLTTGVNANFTNNIPNSCNPPVTINFINTSTGVGTISYQWDFGDATSSTLRDPSHVYTNPGSYNVSLIVTNQNGCRDTIVKQNAIVIGTVDASFTSPVTVCAGSIVNIVNTSVPQPFSAAWDFGDGSSENSITPSKTYNTPGTYTITMIGNFGACLDTFTRSITVLAKPVVNFSMNDSTSCKAPFSINFTSLAPGATSYLWDFGDGTTSSLANPSYTYVTSGSYTVSLTVTNASGCSTTISKPGQVIIQGPQVQINNLPQRGCTPFTTTFAATTNSIDPVVGYLWNFGDGNTSTLVSPSHTYTSSGTYNITLIITTAGGCSDTSTVASGVIVSSKPVANFVASPRDVCAFVQVNFTDLSTGNVNQWFWEFGDGGTSTLQNPGHSYNDTGNFNVTLIVWNNGCPDTVRFMNYIHVKPPIASFIDMMDCTLPLFRQFSDSSIGADTWTWDFGDGGSSTIQNPTHTYAVPGSYTVKLTVTNNVTGCSHTYSRLINIIIENANFAASDTVICKGTPITFSTIGINTSNIGSHTWDFGDGSSLISTSGTVSHTYTVSGTYSVSLIITDLLSCKDTLIKSLYIQVDGPTAQFTSSVPGTCLNTPITFTDSSYSDGTHPIQQYAWDYGDGTLDTLSSGPFQHAYAGPGVYTVSLSVTDSKGCVDRLVRANYIIISKPLSDFFTTDTASCPNGDISFTNLSTGPNLTYIWNFGDGNSSTLANPVHRYTAEGLYTIRLFVIDQYGCTDSIIKPGYIKIEFPRANFLMSDSVSTCPPLVVTFTNTSTGIISKNWDFGDGTNSTVDNPSHFYSLPGVFNVVLTVTGPGGCVDTKTKQIIVRGPQGSFTYTNIIGCDPLQTNFQATTRDNLSFIWDFNDGTLISSPDSIISHVYTNPGIYVPKMILVDITGCQVPITGPDTIQVFGVKTNFRNTNFTVCDSGWISFQDSSISNDLITNYQWSFGDGNSSSLQNPTHYYNANGIFYPTLIVTTQFGCKDTLQQPVPVRVVPSPQIAIGGDVGGCIPATLNFTGDRLLQDSSSISWYWNFGNGNTSTLQIPPAQLYPNAGFYTVSLIATNGSGCVDSSSRVVEGYAIPTVVANAGSLVCNGSSVTLSATGAATYNWTPATFLSCTTCATPVATPNVPITYSVTGSSSQGCASSDTVQIAIKYGFKMNTGNGDTVCTGRSVRLNASGADSYAWTPTTWLSNPTVANPVARPLTTTNYMVVGADKEGCFKDTGYVLLRVFPLPTVDAGQDVTINASQTVDLVPIISADVNTVTWSPTSGVFRNFYPGITAKPMATTEYTVEVTNAGGCTMQDRVTVNVICNNANIFIPNSFSPNSDGANDVFYPRGKGLFTIKSLKIFNRWGEMVFERNNFPANEATSGWDGTYKSQKLSTDVYIYTLDVVCENSSVLNFKGNIALLQ